MDTVDDLRHQVDKALNIVALYAPCAGDHHRVWVIDQMVRALTGTQYQQWLATITKDAHGMSHVDLWDTGVAP